MSDELSNAFFRFSLRLIGAEIDGGVGPPSRWWKIWSVSGARVNNALSYNHENAASFLKMFKLRYVIFNTTYMTRSRCREMKPYLEGLKTRPNPVKRTTRS